MIRFFRKSLDLREACRKEYGDEFVELYDKINRGVPIGGLEETIAFLEKVDAVKVTASR